MKVLLLGATGLLGHNVLQRLTAEGHSVVALVRRAGGICAEGPWQVVEGSLLDDDTLAHVAEGCDAVVNCAGVTDMSLRRLDDYHPVNVELCRCLVALCERQGIGTLVHTSTLNTIGYGSAEQPATEEPPMREPFLGSFYGDSKAEGERLVFDAARRHPDWHVVVVNPGFMLGAWDAKPSSGRLLLAAYRHRLMVAPRGGKAFVAVQDVAQAVVGALTNGISGNRYLVCHPEGCMTLRQLYTLQAQVMGYRQRILVLPNWVLSVAGRLGDLLRLCGLRTELSTRNVRQLMVREYYDPRRALDEFKINPTPLGEAIKQFYQWRESHSSK